MATWTYDHKVSHLFIELRKPMQNGFIESFNGKFRAECLDQHWFKHISETNPVVEDWRQEYNCIRSHMFWGNLTPMEYVLNIIGDF